MAVVPVHGFAQSDGFAEGDGFARVTLAPGRTRRFTLGALQAWVRRESKDWHLAWRNGLDVQPEPPLEHHEARWEDLPSDAVRVRIGMRATAEDLVLRPALAPRPVITRPEVPFRLPPGERVQAFVSTPLWVRFDTNGNGLTLQEISIGERRETWFGPSSWDGELCYATRTRLQLDLAEAVPRPFRAITPVEVANLADDVLEVSRLRVPVPNLPLFRSTDGRFWTGAVTFERERGDDTAAVQIGSVAPPVAGECHLQAAPRERQEGAFQRTFAQVFSRLTD